MPTSVRHRRSNRRALRRFGLAAGAVTVVVLFSLFLFKLNDVVRAQIPGSTAAPNTRGTDPLSGPGTGDSLVHIVRELKKCVGPLSKQEEKEFVGVLQRCPDEEEAAIVREVLARTAGVGPTGSERGSGNPVDKLKDLGVPTEEINGLKNLVASWFMSSIGDPRINDPDGQGNPYVATPDQPLKSWGEFASILLPSKNPWGRAVETLLLAESKRAAYERAIEAVKKPALFPEFEGERADARNAGTSSPSGGSMPGLATNRIVKDAAFSQLVLEQLVETPRELVLRGADTGELAASNPDQPLANPLLNRQGQSSVYSVAFGDRLSAASAGQAVSLTGLGQLPATFTSDLISQQLLAAMSQHVASAAQQQLQNLGNTRDFFGPSAGELGNLLGSNTFESLGQGFNPSQLGSGSGGGDTGGGQPPQRLSDIPTTALPPVDQCRNRTPTVSADAAKGLAALLRLPLSPDGSGWTTSYVPAASLIGVSGTNAFSGSAFTFAATSFANTQDCVWVVSSAGAAGTHAVFVEDIANLAGVTAHLI